MTGAASEPLFRFDDVRLVIDGRTVLDGVDAEVPADGVTCLLGPSGSGKSTMLRLCNRLEAPTGGAVRFRGRDLRELDVLELRRRVGMVFQRPTPFPGSVRDNLLVAAPDADDAALVDVLERADLPGEFLDRVADDLSGGEQQRMCVARAMLTEPEVLLMDEATSALDPAATRALERLACDLAGSGTPVVWVTHDLAQARRIGTRRIVVHEGRVANDRERHRFESGEDAGEAQGRGGDGS